MPFGLRNAAQTFLSQIFQRILNEVTQGLDFIFFYLDDILVCSKDEQEHLDHLNVLFERLDSFGINLKPPKCLFGVKTPTFLRHKVSFEGILPSEERINAIKTFPEPKTTKELQRFIG